jgi:hypothetical protein
LLKPLIVFLCLSFLSDLARAETFEERRLRERQEELRIVGAREVVRHQKVGRESGQNSPSNSSPSSPSRQEAENFGASSSGQVKAQAARGLKNMVPTKANLSAVGTGIGAAAPKSVERRPGISSAELKAALSKRKPSVPAAKTAAHPAGASPVGRINPAVLKAAAGRLKRPR